MSLVRLVINSGLSVNGFNSVCDLSPGQLPALQNLVNYLESMPDQQNALISIDVGAVQASASFTVSSTGPTNTQAGSLLNQTLTAVTSGADPDAGEFNINATPANVAASMVLAINATLGDKVLASSNLGVVTILALVPGVMGNGLQISAGTLSNVVAGAFADGSDGTSYSLDLR